MGSTLENKNDIINGNTYLGVELGSTRIKAVLLNRKKEVLSTGSFEWENKLENNIWTYSLEDAWTGIQKSYLEIKKEIAETYSITLTKIGCMGFSAMMHGFLVFDEKDQLLTPFRTWRNTMTEVASHALTELFSYHIPQRWSIAHLYQAILNKEEYVEKISFQTTLAGYVHWKLTGKKVLGVGEASGMFPIELTSKSYNKVMMDQFQELIKDSAFTGTLEQIFPKVLQAGEHAGVLTKEGALLLDPSGDLQEGILCCPPEGDAGTGMVATNSIQVRTGNVSAGTSVFAMVVLEKDLKKAYEEIDLVTTPVGDLVAMVHCNNCTSDLNAWIQMFDEFTKLLGVKMDRGELFGLLYKQALLGDKDCGGLLAYNYLSGEHITGTSEGRPLFVRLPESNFTLANFMRVHLYTALGALKTGLDILLKEENVSLEQLIGHGGFFKTSGVGQKMMTAATAVPVSVMEHSGEGGAWGMAVLAAYCKEKNDNNANSLADYLSEQIFADQHMTRMEPDQEDVTGFEVFMKSYQEGLAIEQAAIQHFHS